MRCLMFCLCLAAMPARGATPPDEGRCSQAIAAAQKTLEEMAAKTDRDRQGLQELKQRQERLIADGRRKGESECRIWAQVMGLAFNQ